MRLGQTALEVSPLGVGTWAWGERAYWGYESTFGPRDVVDAFTVSVDAGINWFDTAEIYGHGESEKILGWMVRKHGGDVRVASKFAPLPGRTAQSLPKALDATLKRLGLDRIDLYQLHWCDTEVASIESLCEALADAVASGKVGAVGVSNFSADEMVRAHDVLAARRVHLASNQVMYSLVHRAPEADGVLDACRERGIALMAYSPLAQGLLAGSYAPGTPRPSGRRGAQEMFAPANVAAVQPVVAALREIGSAHGNLSPEAVALAWLIGEPNVVAIPGAKTADQATRNASALGCVLTDAERTRLDEITRPWRVKRR